MRKQHIDPEQFLRRENNNFDLIRLLGACTVIFSHTYAIAWADFAAEPFAQITDGKLAVGVPFLYMFFFLSGFLVTRSFLSSRNARHFLQKRILRIFPALVVMVLLVMLVVGPMFTELSWGEYFQQRHTWGFLRNISLLRLQTTLPGVFADNPDPYFVQTNLWSVSLEFCWYLLTAVFGVLALFRRRWSLVALWVFLYGSMAFFGDWMLSKDIPLLDLELKPFVRVGIYYVSGMLFYLYRHQFLRLNPGLLVIIIPLWFLSVVNGLSDWTTPLFIPLFTLLFATLRLRGTQTLARLGDPTYGMYIWGVPAQQAIVAWFGPNWMVAFVGGLLLSYALGMLSWHLVEKRALRWKKSILDGRARSTG
ncbi:MAG: acyltransferase [Bacteroidota bacterium]